MQYRPFLQMLLRSTNRPILRKRSQLGIPSWRAVALALISLAWLCSGLCAAEKKPAAKPPAKPAVKPPDKPAPPPASDPIGQAKPGERAEWKPKYYNGRSYVSLAAVAACYGFDKVDVDGREIGMTCKKIRFQGTMGDKRVRLNDRVFYFSFPIISFGGQPVMLSTFDVTNLLDPLFQPNERRDPSVLKVVVIDPAGGGVENGIVSPFGREKDVTLEVALVMKPLLEAWGFTVILTRDGDEAVFPLERVRMANLIHEEAISITLQVASGGSGSQGLETSIIPYANTPATYASEKAEIDPRFYPGNINERESLALATSLQGSLIQGTSGIDLGIKRIPSESLRSIEMPAVVCRLGFLTHPVEGKKLAEIEYRKRLGESLARGVKKYADIMATNLEERRAEDAKRDLVFGRVQATHLDATAGVPGERIIIRVPLVSAQRKPIDRSKLEVQMFVYERINNVELGLTISNAPKIEWLSVLPDWKESTTETFQAIYERPRLTAAETERYGRRAYYGFVARLIYDGRLLDEASDPTNLERSLYYFTPVFPKR